VHNELDSSTFRLEEGTSLISVVVPSYNEQDVLPEFYQRLSSVLAKLSYSSEIVFVNDGSTDGSLAAMLEWHEENPKVAVIDLSRNFGKEIAMSAGMDYAKGDAVVVIDADLQDPPELIPALIEQWEAGFDNVYAKRTEREGETAFKKTTASWFYRLIQRVSNVRIPEDTGDFRLLSRRAVDSLSKLREQHRFMKGLFAWIGYPSKAVPYRRDPRGAGKSKWNYWKLWNFAIEGITSFSILPLKIATYLGIAAALIAFVHAFFVIYKTLVYGESVAGFPTLMVVVLFLGGVQLMSLGIIGEYLGRMFDETKRRPLYFMNNYLQARISAERRDEVTEESLTQRPS